MKKLIYILAATILIYGCKPKAGFGGDHNLSGTVYVLDTLSNNKVPVSNAIVYIGFTSAPNPGNYSYKTITNSIGNFDFTHLIGDKNLVDKTKYKFYLYVSYEQPGTKIVFEKDTTTETTAENIPLILRPKKVTGQINGTAFLRDSLSNQLIAVSGADVYLGYNFQPATTNYTYKLTSDANGNFQTNNMDVSDISAYKFYFKKSVRIGGNTVIFSSALTYTSLAAQGFTVQLLPDDVIGYMTIKTYDNNNTGQPGFTTCLFSNRTIFMNSVLASGSFYSTTTNQKGLAYVSGLGVGSKYYIKSFKVFGNDTIIGKDSIIYTGIFPKDSVLVN